MPELTLNQYIAFYGLAGHHALIERRREIGTYCGMANVTYA